MEKRESREYSQSIQLAPIRENDSPAGPELSDKYVYDSFKRNSLSSEKAFNLGMELNVPMDDIKAIQSIHPNDPVRQAVEIYNKWKKLGLQAPDTAQATEQLCSALREIGKARVARKIAGTRNRSETIEGLQEHYAWDKVKNLTRQQAIELGQRLGLAQEEIDRISINGEHSGGSAAIRLFNEWKSNLEQSTEVQCRIFDDALNSALQKDGGKSRNCVNTSEMIQPAGNTTNGNSGDFLTSGDENPAGREARSCWWKVICILSITMWIILLIVLLIVLALAASLAGNKTEYVLISGSDTVIAHLAFSRMPAQLNIRLFGNEAACQVNIVSIDCSDTNSVTSNRTFISNATDYVYLAEGSMISFDSRSLPQELRPYRIHIFDNINDAYQYEESGPLKFSCSPEQCVVFVNNDDRTKYFQIKTSSYYFIRCERDNYDCSELEGWTYNQMSYNFSLAEEIAESSTTVQALKSTPTKLHVRSAFFSSSNEDMKELCLLSRLKYSSCYPAGEVERNVYYLVIEYPTWTEEYTIYSVIGIGGWLILTVIMSVIPILILIKKKLPVWIQYQRLKKNNNHRIRHVQTD